MATEIRDNLRGPKESAVKLLSELMDTPLLMELEFTVRMGVDMAEEAEYTVRRIIDPRAADHLEVRNGEKV